MISNENVDPNAVIVNKNDGLVRFASFNVWDLGIGELKRANEVAKQILIDLNSPAVVGLVEVIDDAPKTGESDKILIHLCETLNQENDKVMYDYSYAVVEDGKDGGTPGKNIKQAFLYDRNVFERIRRNAKSTDECDLDFKSNPCRIEPQNKAFESSRKPLAARLVFKETKESIVVIVNHFLATPRLQIDKYTADIRLNQAEVVTSFTNKLNNMVICMGDFNEDGGHWYNTMSKSLLDTHSNYNPDTKFTFHYKYKAISKNMQLDYIFANDLMIKYFKASGIPHINAEQKGTSDHDPVYADFKF